MRLCPGRLSRPQHNLSSSELPDRPRGAGWPGTQGRRTRQGAAKEHRRGRARKFLAPRLFTPTLSGRRGRNKCVQIETGIAGDHASASRRHRKRQLRRFREEPAKLPGGVAAPRPIEWPLGSVVRPHTRGPTSHSKHHLESLSQHSVPAALQSRAGYLGLFSRLESRKSLPRPRSWQSGAAGTAVA